MVNNEQQSRKNFSVKVFALLLKKKQSRPFLPNAIHTGRVNVRLILPLRVV
jgi:hypothetical protein